MSQEIRIREPEPQHDSLNNGLDKSQAGAFIGGDKEIPYQVRVPAKDIRHLNRSTPSNALKLGGLDIDSQRNNDPVEVTVNDQQFSSLRDRAAKRATSKRARIWAGGGALLGGAAIGTALLKGGVLVAAIVGFGVALPWAIAGLGILAVIGIGVYAWRAHNNTQQAGDKVRQQWDSNKEHQLKQFLTTRAAKVSQTITALQAELNVLKTQQQQSNASNLGPKVEQLTHQLAQYQQQVTQQLKEAQDNHAQQMNNSATQLATQIEQLQQQFTECLNFARQQQSKAGNLMKQQAQQMSSQLQSLRNELTIYKTSIMNVKNETNSLKQSASGAISTLTNKLTEMQSKYEQLQLKYNSITSQYNSQTKQVKLFTDTIIFPKKQQHRRSLTPSPRNVDPEVNSKIRKSQKSTRKPRLHSSKSTDGTSEINGKESTSRSRSRHRSVANIRQQDQLTAKKTNQQDVTKSPTDRANDSKLNQGSPKNDNTNDKDSNSTDTST